MAGNVNPIPEGCTAVTPYMTVKGASKAIDFYKKAFGAEELFRMPMPDGETVAHAEIQIGNGRVMLGDEFPGQPDAAISPATAKATTVTVHLYVSDCDAIFQRAVDAGAKGVMPPTDMFWGDRFSKVVDPFGHHWSIATHVRDVSPEEMAEAAKSAFSSPGGCGG